MKTYRGKRELLERHAVHIIQEYAKGKRRIVIGLVGGNSVRGIYALLRNARLPWRNMHFFMVDERLVPLTSRKSNYRLAYSAFLKHLILKKKIQKGNVHPLDYAKKDFLRKYEAEFRKLGGRFDIVILSAGEDAHIASLFPKHHSVVDNSSYLITMHDSPKLPKARMSASKALIEKSQMAILLFFGKKRAYAKFMDSTITAEECPAKVVKHIKEANVFADVE
jgi:6-phosphogluconolactonase